MGRGDFSTSGPPRHEAQTKLAAKEPHPRTFDAGYTTEILKTWGESIAMLKDRIAGIKKQLGA